MVDAGRYVSRVHARWLASDPGGGAWAAVDGTLVFADVSGFTALSERLARRGRAGSEELTDLVDAVVDRLLAVTRPRGGDLLRYGGDALLLLFDGPDHEHRAVVAAAAMQTEMSGFRDTRLESGRVTLRMSVGIEAGRVDLFLAGEDHRELLVAGPTASRVVELQHVARAGQIVMGSRVAAVVPGRCRGRRVGDGAVHLRRAAATELGVLESFRPRAVEPSTADTAEVGVPVALRPHLGGTDGEHRQVAVAFVQCRDLDRLLREAGPEAVADELHAFVLAAQRACAHHRVTLLATDVDVSAAKLILVAGAPTTLADDEDRLVAAVRAVLEAHLRQPVRAGVHRGLVFAVEVGDDDRRVYTVLGDTVNVAARVMGVAPDGGLLATTAVLDRLRAAYSHQPVGPFTLKGKTDSIAAAIVDPARGRPPPTLPATDRPLVGREKELAVLAAALERARAGGSPIVEIVGKPGIGKSRLLAEACALAPDLPTVVVQARPYDSAEPYRPVRDPLRSLLGLDGDDDDGLVAEVLAGRVSELVGDLVPLVPLIGVAFGLHLPDTDVTAGLAVDFRREQLHAATTRFLSALLPPSGILVVEDSYWLDDGSVQLLTRLWRALLGTGWAVFVSRADDPSALDLSDVTGVDRLELEPLPVDAARLLARTIGDFTVVEAAALAERSGGNPLFLGELAAAAGRGTSVDDLPDTVEAVIAARLDVLDAHDRDLARVASVLGIDVRADLLLDLATTEGTLDDRRAVRERLVRLAGVLDPDGTGNFRFAHSLMREGAYAGLSFKRRRRLHARAGDLIRARFAGDENQHAAALSLHYHAAHRHTDCWRWSRVAADRAGHAAAPVEAAALLSRALEAAAGAGVPPEEVAAVHEQVGDFAELGGLYSHAADAYRQARRLRVGDARAAGELLRKQGHVAEREARYSVALQLYTRGFRALDGAAPSASAARVRAELTLAYGAARLRQGRYADAVPVLEDAARQAEALHHRAALAHAYYLLDWANTDLGAADSRYRELALPIYEELGNWEGQGNVLINLGVDAYYEGHWDEALDLYRRSREAYERVGAVVLAAAAANNIGEILSDQGHLDAACAEFEAALEVWRLSAYTIGVGLATANLGRAAARSGDLARAESLLAEAIAKLRRIGANAHLIDAEAREAERLLLVADPAAAITVARRTLARAEQPVQRAFLDRTIGWAHALQGDLDAAIQALDDSLAAAVAAGAPYEEALTRLAIARLTSPAGAESTGDPVADAILSGLGVVATPLPHYPTALVEPGDSPPHSPGHIERRA